MLVPWQVAKLKINAVNKTKHSEAKPSSYLALNMTTTMMPVVRGGGGGRKERAEERVRGPYKSFTCTMRIPKSIDNIG